ncbi:uncharacterized protein METZ01_LOCUS176593 [marine metagenome]|uniref:Uncharacterized protein n=1 Tax=marine metagenome TaxID=408172 RepID=A0A382CD04_9ZZZZ
MSGSDLTDKVVILEACPASRKLR